MLTALVLAAPTALAAQGSSTGGGDASTTVTMSFALIDSLTLTITGDATGNTTLAAAANTLDFGNVYYGALGPLGTAGMAYVNLVEGKEYVVGKFQLAVSVTGLIGTADISASQGAGAVTSDAANITPVITNLNSVVLWAANGTLGVNDLTSNPNLGLATNLLPSFFEAGWRIDQSAVSGANTTPFVITASPN